uniref:Hexosyltransferase n=1 Tax=Ostreococcus mediterraneus TaxID=1486918 RepID=A0A7S0KEI9_9CHLO|mmetsp:Transcript_321/g.1339  ORF Transcript_321/g.1339 Transcript_321/m.1339 type:complete len:320 (+) Transcript_321:110-1069(+)
MRHRSRLTVHSLLILVLIVDACHTFLHDGPFLSENLAPWTSNASTHSHPPVIACWVLSSRTLDGLERRSAIRHGWGDSCDYLEFVDNTTVGIDVDWVEKYEDISAKSYQAWGFMYDKYVDTAQIGTATVDFVLKADTDTYIIWENARKYLNQFNSSFPHYLGRKFVDARHGPFVAGTAIILSREALRIFQERRITGTGPCSRNEFAAHKQAEDVALAHCMGDVGIYPANTCDESGAERFMVLSPQQMHSEANSSLPSWYMGMSHNKKRGVGCCSMEAIAFHYVSTEELANKTLVFRRGEWSWTGRSQSGVVISGNDSSN